MKKKHEVEEEFYSASAMIDRSWTGTNQRMRSAVNKLAGYGFHHREIGYTTIIGIKFVYGRGQRFIALKISFLYRHFIRQVWAFPSTVGVLSFVVGGKGRFSCHQIYGGSLAGARRGDATSEEKEGLVEGEEVTEFSSILHESKEFHYLIRIPFAFFMQI
ncbi:hypothetical protein C0J52_01433 [Blattella germanica]|nr:hypothetical protein C0J52_01433 [Blattella germanica]